MKLALFFISFIVVSTSWAEDSLQKNTIRECSSLRTYEPIPVDYQFAFTKDLPAVSSPKIFVEKKVSTGLYHYFQEPEAFRPKKGEILTVIENARRVRHAYGKGIPAHLVLKSTTGRIYTLKCDISPEVESKKCTPWGIKHLTRKGSNLAPYKYGETQRSFVKECVDLEIEESQNHNLNSDSQQSTVAS